jgi:hypothetical protein
MTVQEFLAKYNADGRHPVYEINGLQPESGTSPFIHIRHGAFEAIVNPMAFDDHLSIDVHSFVDDEAATAGAFGMTRGREVSLPETGTTSHGWHSANLVVVLVGEQGGK